MNKKYIIIGIAVLIVILVLSYVVFGNTTDSKLKQSVQDDKLHNAILGYDSLVDYSQKVTVWREMMKACPYWQDYASANLNTGQFEKEIKLGFTVDDYYTQLATGFIDDNKNIMDAYNLCLDDFDENSIKKFKNPCNKVAPRFWNALLGGAPMIFSWVTKGKAC